MFDKIPTFQRKDLCYVPLFSILHRTQTTQNRCKDIQRESCIALVGFGRGDHARYLRPQKQMQDPNKATSTESQLTRTALQRATNLAARVRTEVAKAYVGSAETVDNLLTALLARGHILLEGVPGVAKTTLVKTFSSAVGCQFGRVQFTPDLLPADITGTHILDVRDNTFVLHKGPIFAEVLLADEVNRAPAKTQSALLEAMQEGQVTIEGDTQQLPRPFMVLATQNPIEQEGTYPLPEAQVDRFLMKISLGYPSRDEEERILKLYDRRLAEIAPVCDPEKLRGFQRLVDAVHVDDDVHRYIIDLVAFTRKHRRVYLGCSPRAALNLMYAAKARALLRERDFVLPDDIKALAVAVLAHRILLAPEAELEGMDPRQVIVDALEAVRALPRVTGDAEN